MSLEITNDIARKVLATVDVGLIGGVGQPVPGQMCVEAAVCYALGLPHGDDPGCVSAAVRRLKIRLNDSNWSSPAARAKGLRRLALIQLGSKDALDEKEFARRISHLAVTQYVPLALRAAASIQSDPKHREALINAAVRCAREGTAVSARSAARVAANAAEYAADAAATAARVAANAADAAADAEYAARAAEYAAEYAARAADAAADAEYAANAADAASATERDRQLSAFAESVVQILIEMRAPGAQWLPLTEAA